MTRPGFWRSSWWVAAKDLKIEWRTLEGLSAMVLFALIVLVIFSFAFEIGTVRQLGISRLVPGVLWITLSFSAIVGFARSFHLEKRTDALTALVLCPADRGALFVGKTAANLATLVALESIVVPLSAIFFDYDLLAVLPAVIVVVVLHTWGLAELGTLLGAVATRVGRGEALLATLLFPVASPLLISAVKCTAAVLDGRGLEPVYRWLGVALAFDLLYLFVGLLTFEFVLED